jgi:hypothetical protein
MHLAQSMVTKRQNLNIKRSKKTAKTPLEDILQTFFKTKYGTSEVNSEFVNALLAKRRYPSKCSNIDS